MTCDTMMTEHWNPPQLRTVPSRFPVSPLAVAAQDGRLANFLAYWRKVRQGLNVPFRADIDPRGFEPVLGNSFVAERIAPGLARLRIAGNHLTELIGTEVRGMPLSALIDPAQRDVFSHHLVRLFDEPAMVRLSLYSAAGFGAPALTGQILILPLRSDLGDISRALGCLVTTGNPGRGPRSFEIVHTQITPIEGAAAVKASGQHPAGSQDHTTSCSAGRKGGHLKLIKG